MAVPLPLKGRGTADNPAGRFEPLHYEPDADDLPEVERIAPKTLCYVDSSRSIITQNDSPDVGFSHSLNIYRGCEHGCIYCYARPFHEYLGFSPGLDFETKILVKTQAPALLRQELMHPSWTGTTLALSGVTDCYQPLERKFQLTRQCLEVMAEFRQSVGIVTKSRLIVRDLDVLRELARFQGICSYVSLTTLDAELARKMEPRASTPAARLEAIAALAQAGIPVGVMVAPILPGLTEHEIPNLLKAARQAGAQFAGHIVLRLPFEVKNLFSAWLARHYPDRKARVLGRVRSVRGGKLNSSAFKERMKGTGPWAELIHQVFRLHRRRLGFPDTGPTLSTAHFRRPGARQGELFA
jgi:DNA repair photolyase